LIVWQCWTCIFVCVKCMYRPYSGAGPPKPQAGQPTNNQEFLYISKIADRLWSPHSFQFKVYRGLFPRQLSGQDMKLTPPRLNGAVFRSSCAFLHWDNFCLNPVIDTNIQHFLMKILSCWNKCCEFCGPACRYWRLAIT
jgi:hypothetical protein